MKLVIYNKAETLINEIKNKNIIDTLNIIKSENKTEDKISLEYIDKNGWNALHWK